MGKEPSILYFLKPKCTQLENETPSIPVKGRAINYNGVGYLESNVCLGEVRVW